MNKVTHKGILSCAAADGNPWKPEGTWEYYIYNLNHVYPDPSSKGSVCRQVIVSIAAVTYLWEQGKARVEAVHGVLWKQAVARASVPQLLLTALGRESRGRMSVLGTLTD